MKCQIRKWRMDDAADLAELISNKKIQDNLRDGLPFPYTKQDGESFISEMLSADENDTFSFAITVDGRLAGSIACFDRAIFIPVQQRWATILVSSIGAKAL